MRNLTIAGLAASLLALMASAHAASAPKGKDPNKRICTTETIVGSHLPRRVCATEAERDELRRASQDKMGNLQRHGRVGGSRTGPN